MNDGRQVLHEVKRPSNSTNLYNCAGQDFAYSEIFANKNIPAGQKTQKDTGAEEIAMIGVQLPVSALGKAMIVSGLMWLAIGYQAFVWMN